MRHALILIIIFFGLDAFSQGASSNNYEVISRVYFGTPPFDGSDIMNPPTGTNELPCTGYSDFSVGNTNNGDGNVTGLEYFTGVVRDATYSLEIEGGFCGNSPTVFNPNRAMKVYIDYDLSGTFETDELVFTSGYFNINNPIANTTITIPSTASLGETKMRIIYNRVGLFTALWQVPAINWATNNFQYGEAEDYTIYVVGYLDSVYSTSTTCYNSSDGQIEIFPNTTAPSTTEYSINGLAGPWSTDLIYTNLTAGNYDIWARDGAMSPNFVYEQLQTTVASADTVFVNPQVTSNYNGFDISCVDAFDGEITLSSVGGDASSYSYEYYSLSNPNQITINNNVITGLTSDTYFIAALDAQGCTSSTIDVVISPPAELVVNEVNTIQSPSCSLSCDATIQIQASGGVPPYNFSVDGNNNGTNNVFQNVCTGTPLVLLTDANNCSVSYTNLTIPDPLDLILSATITSNYSSYSISCANASDGIINVSTTGGTGGEYFYSIDGGITFPFSSTNSLDISNLSVGIISLVAIDSNQCQSQQQEIELTSPPPISYDFITTSTPISCYGFSDGEIIAQATGGAGNYEYSLDLGTTAQSSGVFSSLSASTYNVSVVDNNNCVYQEQYILNEPQELTVNSTTVISDFNGSQISCFGASDAVLSIDAFGGIPPYNYALLPNPNYSPLQANNTITNLSAGFQTFQLIDENGCESLIENFEITQPDEIIISDINPVSNVSCYGGSDGAMTINASGGTGSYSYFVDDLYNSNNQAPYEINGLSPNDYSVVVSDMNNCTSQSFIQSITQPTQLNPNLSYINIGCNGDTGSATVNPSGGTPNYSITWSTGSSNNSINQLTSGFYSVIVVDALGCQESIDFQITEPDISMTVTPISCTGDNTGEIQATLNNPNPASIYSILWDDINAQNTNTAVGLSSGEYSVSFTDQFGCELIGYATIDEPDSMNIFVEHTQLCQQNTTASALVFTSGGQTPYYYMWSTGETSELINISEPGTYSVQVTDFNNCQQETSFTIEPLNPIELDFVINVVSCVDNNDGSILALPSGGYEPYTFTWSNYTQLALISGIQSGIYGLTIIDNNQCEYFQEIEVPVSNQPCITAYSAFSPNGDQNNDYWHIDNIELYPDAIVEVFNRWGDRVYSTKRYINSWDSAWQGLYKNSPLPSATYYYVITLNNDDDPLTGTVTIVR